MLVCVLLEFGLSDIQCSWWQSSCTNGIGMCLLVRYIQCR